MKTKILKGIVMMSAVVLGACTTTKYAAQQKDYNDDVYYSKAKAGDEVEYASNNRSYRSDGYYDNYASRISRFGGYSPFAYDGFYNSYYGAGLGLGLGYGLGSFYGYSPYSLYSPYSFYGGGLGGYGLGGYGFGSPYWGLASGYTTVSTGARPSRGTGNPGAAYNNTGMYNGTLRNGNTSVIGGRTYTPSMRTSSGNTYNNNGGYTQRATTRPSVPQQTPQRSYPTYSAPASSAGSSFGGGGGRVSSGRPGRG